MVQNQMAPQYPPYTQPGLEEYTVAQNGTSTTPTSVPTSGVVTDPAQVAAQITAQVSSQVPTQVVAQTFKDQNFLRNAIASTNGTVGDQAVSGAITDPTTKVSPALLPDSISTVALQEGGSTTVIDSTGGGQSSTVS